VSVIHRRIAIPFIVAKLQRDTFWGRNLASRNQLFAGARVIYDMAEARKRRQRLEKGLEAGNSSMVNRPGDRAALLRAWIYGGAASALIAAFYWFVHSGWR